MRKEAQQTRPPRKVLFCGIDPLDFQNLEMQLAEQKEDYARLRTQMEDATGVRPETNFAENYGALLKELPPRAFRGVALWHYKRILESLARVQATASAYARAAAEVQRSASARVTDAETRASIAETEATRAKAAASQAEKQTNAISAQFADLRAAAKGGGNPPGLILFGEKMLRLGLYAHSTTKMAKPVDEAGEEIADAMEESFVSEVTTTTSTTHDVLDARVRESALIAALVAFHNGQPGQNLPQVRSNNNGNSGGQQGGEERAASLTRPPKAPPPTRSIDI